MHFNLEEARFLRTSARSHARKESEQNNAVIQYFLYKSSLKLLVIVDTKGSPICGHGTVLYNVLYVYLVERFKCSGSPNNLRTDYN